MLDTLPSKWNPRWRQPDDYERKTMHDLGREELSKDLRPFDRCVTTHGNISHAFRIFTGPDPTLNETPAMELEEDGSQMTIATDGSCTHNGQRNA